MTQTKKLVCGTQRALNKEIEAHKAKGWQVVHEWKEPRGLTGKFTYLAYLKREKITILIKKQK